MRAVNPEGDHEVGDALLTVDLESALG